MGRFENAATATLGLTLGAGPAMLATLFPSIAGLDQLGVALLGAVVGMRAAGRRPSHRAQSEGRAP